MRKNRAIKRMGLATLAGGLAFVGNAEAVELIVDGSFENTTAPNPTDIVRLGGASNPGINGGWSIFSTYLYSTQYTQPLTNGLGQVVGGAQFLRPYPPNSTGVTHSSDTVTQMVSLTLTTTLTPAKIDAGQATYSMSAYFSTYLTQNDYSDLTLEFQDGQGNVVDNDVPLGGQAFVAALPSGPNSKYSNARYWGQDVHSATVPAGARVALITIHSTALAGLPDGYVDLVSLNVVDTTLTEPFVASADPPDLAINAGPIVTLNLTLQDRVTAVVTNSLRLYLDNKLVPAVIQKAGTNTSVSYNAGLLPALSSHSYSVAFSDNGAPSVTQTNTFRFTVANYVTLPPGLGSPPGSEDATKPGFNVSVYQVQPVSNTNTAGTINIPDSIEFDEGLLASLAGTNIADLRNATSGNTFSISNTVHWVNSTGTSPNFPAPGSFPGIPGTLATEDNFVDDIRTYVRFPTNGFYQMGVNNNDDLRLSAEENASVTLQITSPTNMEVLCVAIATNVTQLSFGGALPLTPITGRVVYATPSGNPADSCTLATNSALLGNIALLDRGSTNCTSADDAYQAQLAGAIAVLETTPGDPGFPFRLGDSDSRVTIPVLVIAENFGGQMLKGFLNNHQTVMAKIAADAAPRLAEWNGPKGFGSVDSLVGFAVPAAGVYPLRLIAGHSTGAANLEWFSILPDGTRVLLNDLSNPKALPAFRARTVISKPALNAPTLSGGKITISWTGAGTLEEAPALSGPWQTSASQSNPQNIPTTGGTRFYRIHSP